jgi:hypothetical protein
LAGESDPETPAQAADATVKEDFRRIFNEKVYGIIEEGAGQSSTDGGTGSGLIMSPTQLTNSIQMTQQRLNKIVEMIEQRGTVINPNKAFQAVDRYAVKSDNVTTATALNAIRSRIINGRRVRLSM